MEIDKIRYEKIKNILTIIILFLLSIFLFFKVYVYFSKSVKIVVATVFPFVLSFIIVYCLMPFIDILSNRFKLNRKLSILIVLSMFFCLFGYIILAFIPIVIDQLTSLIKYFSTNQQVIQKQLDMFVHTNSINVKEIFSKIRNGILPNILSLLNISLSLMSSIFSLLFMTPIFTIMLIFSYDNIEAGVEKKMIYLKKEHILPLMKNINNSISKYVKVTLIDCFIVGITSFILLSILNVSYVQLFAIIIGIGNLIPFIGPFIGLTPVLIYALTQSFDLFLIILIVMTIVQAIEANIVKPLLTSQSIDIHPITVLLVVLVFGALFGIPGAFLAVPIYIAIKLSIIFFYFPENN